MPNSQRHVTEPTAKSRSDKSNSNKRESERAKLWTNTCWHTSLLFSKITDASFPPTHETKQRCCFPLHVFVCVSICAFWYHLKQSSKSKYICLGKKPYLHIFVRSLVLGFIKTDRLLSVYRFCLSRFRFCFVFSYFGAVRFLCIFVACGSDTLTSHKLMSPSKSMTYFPMTYVPMRYFPQHGS